MTGDATSDDLDRFARLGRELVEGVRAQFGPWVTAAVLARGEQFGGTPASPALRSSAQEAGVEASRRAVAGLGELVRQQLDEQRRSPLEVLRAAMAPATAALSAAGVAPVVRDEVAERLFPDDPYDLGPAAFADIDEDLAGVALAWGAAKAYLVMAGRPRSSSPPRPSSPPWP